VTSSSCRNAILQFAFNGDPADRFLPHNYEPNTVVYTGTHDNDTTLGWFHQLPPREAQFVPLRPHVERDVTWELLRLAWSSVANLARCRCRTCCGWAPRRG
jgi:4-alpha-glucanotransferase